MDKINIRIENFLLSLRLMMRNGIYQRMLLLEGMVLLAALGLFFSQFGSLPGNDSRLNEPGRTIPQSRTEVNSLPSDLFYSDKAAPAVKQGPVFPKLNLTGTGRVKGAFKASIEDAEGNYYYVREGEKIKGLLVKKITEREAQLMDHSGNLLTLTLER